MSSFLWQMPLHHHQNYSLLRKKCNTLCGRIRSSSFKEARDGYGDSSRIESFNGKYQETICKANSATRVQEVNRGGLILITEETQNAFISIEACTKANLTVNKGHTLDDTTRHCLRNELFTDSYVQFYWCLTGITLKIGNLKAEELLNLYIDQWISVWGNSIANSFINSKEKGTEKSKAQRKTIE